MGTGLDPKRWVELENWRLAFDERFLERPRDRSACFEARDGHGKSSPNNILLALGKGSSPKLTLALFMAAKTFFLLNTEI